MILDIYVILDIKYPFLIPNILTSFMSSFPYMDFTIFTFPLKNWQKNPNKIF